MRYVPSPKSGQLVKVVFAAVLEVAVAVLDVAVLEYFVSPAQSVS